MRAGDIMGTPVVTVPASATIAEIARVLIEHGVGAVPVVDEAGKLLGIVCESDLLRRRGASGRARRWLAMLGNGGAAFLPLDSHHTTANDIMSAPAIAVPPGMPLGEVVQVMERTHLKRLPVVQGVRVVGIVSRADLTRAMAASGLLARSEFREDDREIRRLIVTALAAADWVASARVNAMVVDGKVHLWGAVQDDQQHEALCSLVGGVPGVKAVEDYLTWAPLSAAGGLL